MSTAEDKMARALSVTIRLFVIVVIAIGILIGWLASGVLAHEWYPTECCSGSDCAPAGEDRIAITAHGYVVDKRFVVPFSEARRSQDGRYHVCFPTPDNLRCLFAPPQGS